MLYKKVVCAITLLCFCIACHVFTCGIVLWYPKSGTDCAIALTIAVNLIKSQHHRGQDGIGLTTCIYKHNRLSTITAHAKQKHGIDEIHKALHKYLLHQSEAPIAFIGHIRYSTYAGSDICYCQPTTHVDAVHNNTMTIAGNFNITNINAVQKWLMEHGVITATTVPSDTEIITALFNYFVHQEPADNIDIVRVVQSTTALLDGGYVFVGALSNGTVFVCRDPAGIRPCFYYENKTYYAIASERHAIVCSCGCTFDDIQELKPGHVLVLSQSAAATCVLFCQTRAHHHCIFERIYLSSAEDPDIFTERKTLGRLLAQRVLAALDYDTTDTIFTYVPHSAHASFIGMIEEAERITENNVHVEHTLITKQKKRRTFITATDKRQKVVSGAYTINPDVIIGPQTTIVVLDDSIVRGTTMRTLLGQLIAQCPKRIVVVSTTPPIIYPDGYGIDMSQIGQLVAFQALATLIQKTESQELLDAIAITACQNPATRSTAQYIWLFYQQIGQVRLEQQIAELLRPNAHDWSGDITVIYQTIDGLHAAMPTHRGDWYFTGAYPTPGGFSMFNRSYLQWYTCAGDARAY